MRRGAQQSQVVNNFFSLATIVMVSVVLILYLKYVVKEPQRINSNLVCQLELTSTTDKISNEQFLKTGYKLLNDGSYELDGGMIPSLENPVITKKIDLKQINNIFLNTIDIKLTKQKRRFLKIKYELIENEDDSKDNVASLLTSFRVNNKEVFRMNIDFLKYDLIEIEKRVQCTMEAFKHNAKI
mgnify:CR=1 FL=1